jgi:hypothetical protein
VHKTTPGALALASIAALLLVPLSTSAHVLDGAVLRWAIVETPGYVPQKNDVRSSCEINCLAVASDGALYAVDIANASPGPMVVPGLWLSTDGGFTWSDKAARGLAKLTSGRVTAVAVAPDRPGLIAVVCTDGPGRRREIFVSRDGGDNWQPTGAVPWRFGVAEQVGAISISPAYVVAGEKRHDIIIGSRDPSNAVGTGEIYVLAFPGLGGWRAQGFAGGDVIALQPSPNYASDAAIVVMSSTTQATYISLGKRDMAANVIFWEVYSGFPVELCEPTQAGATSSGKDKVITGSLALPADFNGTVKEKRVIFASYDSNNTAYGKTRVLDDVYRLDDTRVTRLNLPGAGTGVRTSSIAYHGDCNKGKLLAGAVAAELATAQARVWRSADPLSACPVWKSAAKPPTGGSVDGYANVQLVWSVDGSAAYGGTGSGNRKTPQEWADISLSAWAGSALDESAVSVSRDDGVSWDQTGLIDTAIDRLAAIAPSEDEKTLYVATTSALGFDSVWRSQPPGKKWRRVLCCHGDSPLLRLAPDEDNASHVFWADQGTTNAAFSADSGATWQEMLPNLVVQDMAAADVHTVYILQADGRVRRGKYTGGWTWGEPASTGLGANHNIAVSGSHVLVTAAAYQNFPLAYSADGGDLWHPVTARTPTEGNRHVAFDDRFSDNHLIYLADDAGGIYRLRLGKDGEWQDMAPPHHSFYGVVIGKYGVLYAAYSYGDSGVDRALYPRTGIPKPGVYWDSLDVGLGSGVNFSAEPGALAVSQNTLWALDAREYKPLLHEGCLWVFIDTLAMRGPRLIFPKNAAVQDYDVVSGRNRDIAFGWEQLSLADCYEFELAADEDFTLRIVEVEPTTNPFYLPPVTSDPAYRIPPGTVLEAGKDYFWRVRVRRAATGQVIRSPWSRANAFTISPGVPVVGNYPPPEALAPAHGALKSPAPAGFSWTPLPGVEHYLFVLARDSALREVIVREEVAATAYRYEGELEPGCTYFWQVTPLQPPGSASAVFMFTVVKDKPVVTTPPHDMGQIILVASMVNLLAAVTFLLAMLVVVRYRQR